MLDERRGEVVVGRLLRQLRNERRMSLLKVEELTEKLGSRVPRSRLSMLERGDVLVQLDDFSSERYGKAFDEAVRAARVFRAEGIYSNASRQLLRAAQCKIRSGDASAAIRYARDGVALAEQTGQLDCRAWSLVVLGETLAEGAEQQEAEKVARQACDLLRLRTDLHAWKARVYRLLESLALTSGDSRAASKWQRESRRLGSLANTSNTQSWSMRPEIRGETQ